ncbi:hypothetical protein Enr13x_34190 [Stieleria neptunia]|uniref:Uncharacterized protein n=1 Tax=Stieleria neptunia TaxID=2527979 RepID=A0A518HRT7_9BACT|nr:hypothetical protein [Stieleria neptunia]QDV43562.1 hypothetical protein Enr13x_34190 [Stieleria neptunia]
MNTPPTVIESITDQYWTDQDRSREETYGTKRMIDNIEVLDRVDD